MRFNITIVFCFLSIVFNNICAQDYIEYKFDLSGFPIGGYIDPIAFSPDKGINYMHYLDAYSSGYYYNHSGEKVDGFIKFKNRSIQYKNEKSEYKERFKPTEVKYFVIGVDSFFTATNFEYGGRKMSGPEYLQFVAAFDTVEFAKYYHFNQSGVGDQSFYDYYLYRTENDGQWRSMSDKQHYLTNGFRMSFSSCFDIVYNSKPYTEPDNSLLKLIKTAEYQYKYDNSECIYLNENWQEIKDEPNFKYYARIINKIDSIWNIAYYNETNKLYEVSYSSIFPNKKYGYFKIFNPEGGIRKLVEFENNKAISNKTYTINGDLQSVYKLDTVKRADAKSARLRIIYEFVADSKGNNLIQQRDSFMLTMHDTILNRDVFQYFRDGELVKSTFEYKEMEVYQITDPNYKFKIKSIQSAFNSYMSDQQYEDEYLENAQGQVLVSVIINKKGYVESFIPIFISNSGTGNMVTNFYNFKLTSGVEDRYRFKPLKINKEKVYCELVIPFDIGISSFYSRPIQYNYYYDHMFWNNMHMMQNYSQPNIPLGPAKF